MKNKKSLDAGIEIHVYDGKDEGGKLIGCAMVEKDSELHEAINKILEDGGYKHGK